MINIEEVKKIITVLIGERIQYISRSCELIDIGFGDMICKKNARGEDIIIPTYALHLQCPFRISDSKGVVIGSDDLFISSTGIENSVDLSLRNICVFDDQLVRNKNAIENAIISDVQINKYGDLKIFFSEFVISIFSVSSADVENWRFFKTGAGGLHIIKNGNHFEISL